MKELPIEITENRIHYTLHGDYYLPDLEYPQDDRPIGKWGRMHMNYLRDHKPGAYSQLLLSGALNYYLADLNEHAQDRLSRIVKQMAVVEGVNESLKADDQMEWFRRMNSILNRAEEIVKSEIILS